MGDEPRIIWGEVLDDREAVDALARYTADGDWIWSHLRDLRKRYPDQYVAVVDKKVICSASNMPGIVKQLTAKGIHPGSTMVDFIRTDDYPSAR